MDINPILSVMEFLDLSDANDDEKAEAMAIIGSAPVYGVEFPFDFKTSSDLSEMSECLNSLSPTEQEGSQGVIEGSRHLNEINNLRRKQSPTHEFVGSLSGEAIPQPLPPMSQWEMTASTIGPPVVCGPPQYIYHQAPSHYYPTNAPMPGHYYSPVANGSIGLNSTKEVNKMRSTGPHNSNKSMKGVHSPDMRAPFYPPHNQYSDVPQLIDNSRAPPSIVNDGMMALTNGPPVQPMFGGFPPQFLPHPHSPFPVQQMYIIATPEGSYLTYGLPTQGVQMTRPSTPPSVPNVVTEDISVITSNVPSNDGNGSTAPMDEVINSELEDDIVVESNDENNIHNQRDNQNYDLNNEIIDSNVDGIKDSDIESNKVINNSESGVNDSIDNKNEIQINTSLPSTQENSVLMTQSLSSSLSSSTSPNDTTGAAYSNASGSQKSWADLFKGRSSGASIHNSLITSSNHSSSALTSGPIVSQNYNSLNLSESDSPLNSSVNCESERCAQIQCIPMCNDSFARKLAKRVFDLNLKHYLPFLIHYGLVNRGNWCYINATLQALVGCPPFYNLMREIGETPGLFRERSSTPIIDSFAKFFTHFTPCEHLTRKQKTGANMSTEDMPKGEPIEPRCIYDVLGAIKSECLKGRQEDAEEFLSSVLNGLHDEMIALFKLSSNQTEKKSLNGDHLTANGHINRDENGTHLQDIDNDSNNDDDDSNLWKEVTPRHKAMPTRSTKVISTPIFDMFGGSTLSVRTAGKDICGNRQPFFTLQLDIQSDKVKSVEDALKCLTTSESIQGYMCPKTKQAMDASAQTFLDTLPPILILHLKLFVYDMDGGCRKLMKRIEYPVDLELPRECLHYDKWEREKNLQLKRYKLLSVVYHDGAEAIKGHYVTDVYHIGSNQWLRCDDGSVKGIPIQKVLNTDTSRTPYLLFYRRFDTLYSKHSISSNNSKTFSH